MRPSVIFEKWDVVAVDYPFVEATDYKRRPAVVVSGRHLRDGHRLYWAVMVTTGKAGMRADDIPIGNREAAGVPEDCVIRPSRIMTVNEARIVRRLGGLGTSDRSALNGALKRMLG